jgi:hypothetical protein
MSENLTALPRGFVRLSGTAQDVANKLGPLADLVGTWRGNSGWNLIAVPAMPQFKLLIQNYSETITFTAIGAPVPNRGENNVDQFITGLTYELAITDNATEGVLHIENGMWLFMGDIEAQPGIAPLPIQYSIARQSSIPHGDVVIALGNAVATQRPPVIPNIDSRPPDIGKPKIVGYLDAYQNTDFRQFNAVNPNYMLQQTIKTQTITNVTTITVDTANQGGSIVNIPFIDQHVNPTRFMSTFWLEDVVAGGLTFKQLQYSQQADLNFDNKFNAPGIIMWPHVNVNTLRKQ